MSLGTRSWLLVALLAACGGDPDPVVPHTPSPEVVPDEPDEPESSEPESSEPTPSEPIIEPAPPSQFVAVGPYLADIGRDCDGLPFLPLATLPTTCVGLVVHPQSEAIASTAGRFRPRSLVQDPALDDVFWVVDAGARRPRAGRVWRVSKQGDSWRAASVLRRLDRPHGSRIGPDGKIYVGEVQRIIRFDPSVDDPRSTVEVVVDDMPVQLRGRDRLRFHPLTSFVFTPSWDLIVNMGSGTDRCLESVSQPACEDEREHLGALWRYEHLGDARWAPEPNFLVHGLRNSVALVAHRSGTLLQAENGVDFSEADRPHEELNIIEAGKHYGWPYCFDRDQRDPRWTHAPFVCDPARNPRYAPPHLLLPPHAAPLGMTYYQGPLFAPLAGNLLIAYHGYRTPGHRVVAFAVDTRGVPTGSSRDVIAGWQPTDDSPRGAPVDMTVARDGSLWLVEDKNGTVLRMAADRWAASRTGGAVGSSEVAALAADDPFISVLQTVLLPRCGHCHEFLRQPAAEALTSLTREGWLRGGDQVVMASRIGADAVRRMPPDRPLTAAETAMLMSWLASPSANLPL